MLDRVSVESLTLFARDMNTRLGVLGLLNQSLVNWVCTPQQEVAQEDPPILAGHVFDPEEFRIWHLFRRQIILI